MIHELGFGISYAGKDFSIDFDSESPTKNLLMNVWMENYPIDTVELRNTHRILYSMIQIRMRKTAEAFWNENKAEQKATFEKLPSLNGIMEIVSEQILKPYGQSFLTMPKNKLT